MLPKFLMLFHMVSSFWAISRPLTAKTSSHTIWTIWYNLCCPYVFDSYDMDHMIWSIWYKFDQSRFCIYEIKIITFTINPIVNRKSGLKLYNRRSVYISGVLLGDKILVCSLKTQDKRKTSFKVWSKLIHMQDSLIPTDKFLLGFTSARLIACFVLTCYNTHNNHLKLSSIQKAQSLPRNDQAYLKAYSE